MTREHREPTKGQTVTLHHKRRVSLQRSAEDIARAYAAREREIREAVKAGGSYREVAALAGVSHQTVANIVNRQTDK